MADLFQSFQSATLEVVASLRDRHIGDVLSEQRSRSELLRGVREALKNGADINSVSEASGLTVEEIRKDIEREALLVGQTR
jgi:hypothetical protein